MSKRVIIFFKIVIFLGILAFVGRFVITAWHDASQGARHAHIPLTLQTIHWGYAALAMLAFVGVMLSSALTWRWLAWKMGDRSRAHHALGAYTFSQMGKYVPGKIALLLMRIDRSGRFGMTPAVCTLSTLLENALYMISGGLVGMIAIAHIAEHLPPDKQLFRAFLWPVTIAALLLLGSACVPAVFYRLVNLLLQRMKKPEVPPEQRLKMPTLALGVVGFVPCWIFGGLALWASASCIHPLPIASCAWFMGAFSLSVVVGMLSLLPGGAGIREVVIGTAFAIQMLNCMSRDEAVLLSALAAVLQRAFQLGAELILGIAGAIVTSRDSEA